MSDILREQITEQMTVTSVAHGAYVAARLTLLDMLAKYEGMTIGTAVVMTDRSGRTIRGRVSGYNTAHQNAVPSYGSYYIQRIKADGTLGAIESDYGWKPEQAAQ